MAHEVLEPRQEVWVCQGCRRDHESYGDARHCEDTHEAGID